MVNNNINEEKDQLIFYSDYGYVKVGKNSYENNSMIDFININNSFQGVISKKNLISQITIRIKTLYGIRKIYSFNLSIGEKFIQILSQLNLEEGKNNLLKEKYDKNKSFRIISTKGQIKEIKLTNKIYEEKIENNQLLILAPNDPIKFCEINHGDQIDIERGLIANKMNGDDLQIALINKGCSKDYSYTEFILESEPDEKGIIIGISLKRDDYYMDEMDDFWGYVLSDSTKINLDNELPYGEMCKIGDIVGVFVKFDKNNKVSVSFYLNGKSLGVAFDNLKKDIYYPAVILYYEGSKVRLNENSKMPENANLI